LENLANLKELHLGSNKLGLEFIKYLKSKSKNL